MTRLFVIGNGFDIKHGLKTNYKIFKNEVAKNDLKLFEIINKAEKVYNERNPYNTSNEWSNFEELLRYIDFADYNSNYINNPIKLRSKNNNSNILNNNNKIIDDINKQFNKWVSKVKLKISGKSKKINNDNYYLSFNYTKVLQKKYNINKKNINQIHLCKSSSRPFIFGMKKIEEDKSFSSNFKGSLNEIINDTSNIFEKPVDKIIDEGLVNYKNLKEIYFWGFSLSDVDKPYIEKIFDNNKNTIEKIYLCKHQFDRSDKEHFVEFLKKYNLENKLESFNDHLIDNKTMKPFKRFISAIVFCIFVYQGVRMILGLNEVVKSKTDQ
ncbi:AbiH family protein [Staphylococcus saprophyticus]|uniref:AbiH family protein n=1 Tax=Staphylococcus saprophyticus TaxID=29385 RepID=UPI00142FD774|nr:AbiH family protein [Staphylococcus saprophyticus]MCM3121028.1 bacteriophage abortive infection AbiH family protein [Staphylococcus saprophyticus]MDW3923044.1 AbiH family protein [Staphylococcus saprophyticus]MDW3972454.1 AbiH family protein [Staphylococcus saprophyticus]MDW4020892.1 AbiH family protein [Staphylococcus saprophyticus]MDW4048710.1 AbiH family protein [Staphylococcus saprophyticus]